jgi:hypothetical protein
MYIGRHARKLLISNPSNFNSWVRKKLVVSISPLLVRLLRHIHIARVQAYVKKAAQRLNVVGYETNVRISSKVNKVITDKINNARSLLASHVCPCARVKIFECAAQLQYTLMQIRTSLKRLQPLNQLAQTLARIWLGKDSITGVTKGLLAQLAFLVHFALWEHRYIWV